MKIAVPAAALVAVFALAGNASAGLYLHGPLPRTLSGLEHRQATNVWHAETTLRFFNNHPEFWPFPRRARAEKRWAFRAVIKPGWLVEELSETRARIHAAAERAWANSHPASTGLPPHYSAWLCIHSHEGSWTDSGDPYWGGLQFGASEWATYGGRYAPTADQATPLQQMWAAEAYWRVSGFSPWPSTAAACGLL